MFLFDPHSKCGKYYEQSLLKKGILAHTANQLWQETPTPVLWPMVQGFPPVRRAASTEECPKHSNL